MIASNEPASLRSHPAKRAQRKHAQPSSYLVRLLIAFLALEYLRPPFLEPLHLPMFFVLGFPILWLTSKERPWTRNLSLILAFLVTGLISLPFASNNFVVYMNARLMFGYLVTALATVWLLSYRQNFQRVLWTWVGIMCFQAVWAAIGPNPGRGYGSFLWDENDLALACGMAFPFPFLGFQYYRGVRRWACALATLLLVTGVVVSFSRGGFLGLTAALGYCLLAGRHRVRNLTIGGVLAVVFLLAAPSGYKTEMRSIQDTSTGTAETRLFLWMSAARMWQAHPILGVGPNNHAYLIGRYQPPGRAEGLFSAQEFHDRDWSMESVHSFYFQLLADRGIVGIVLFSWMLVGFYTGLRGLRRAASRMRGVPRSRTQEVQLYALALEAAMAGFLVAGAFLSMLYYPYFWWFTALAVAYRRAVQREHASQARRRLPRSAAPARADPQPMMSQPRMP